MTGNQIPRDAIFIKWGLFQASISGRLAIIAVMAGGLLFFVGRYLGVW